MSMILPIPRSQQTPDGEWGFVIKAPFGLTSCSLADLLTGRGDPDDPRNTAIPWPLLFATIAVLGALRIVGRRIENRDGDGFPIEIGPFLKILGKVIQHRREGEDDDEGDDVDRVEIPRLLAGALKIIANRIRRGDGNDDAEIDVGLLRIIGNALRHRNDDTDPNAEISVPRALIGRIRARDGRLSADTGYSLVLENALVRLSGGTVDLALARLATRAKIALGSSDDVEGILGLSRGGLGAAYASLAALRDDGLSAQPAAALLTQLAALSAATRRGKFLRFVDDTAADPIMSSFADIESGIGLKALGKLDTIALTDSKLTGSLSVAKGGTGATTAGTALANLGGIAGTGSLPDLAAFTIATAVLNFLKSNTSSGDKTTLRSLFGLGSLATLSSVTSADITSLDAAKLTGSIDAGRLSKALLLLVLGRNDVGTLAEQNSNSVSITGGTVLGRSSFGDLAGQQSWSVAITGGSITGVAGLVATHSQEFNSSSTWTKPSGISWVYVQAWAGGGGSRNSSGWGGGGGGEYVDGLFPATDVSSSVSVSIGAGGSSGISPSAGGNSSFGSLVVARGGLAGFSLGGGAGAGGVYRGAVIDDSKWATGGYSGAGGGAGTSGTSIEGGASTYGGGGGAAAGQSSGTYGGRSQFGGNGADSGRAAAIPGGGGSGSYNGVRGRVIVRAW
jgi:hypothetical protein